MRRLPSLNARALAIAAVCLSLLVSMVAVAEPASALTTGQIATRIVAKVNAIRAAHHLPALAGHSRLNASARAHSDQMASHNVLTLRTPGELSVSTRIRSTGFASSPAYENVGTSRGAAGLMTYSMLIGGPLRRAHVLSRTVNYVGINVRWDAGHHRYWLTLDFGRAVPPASQVYANAVLRQLNAERRAHGLPALSMNSRLIASAHAHNLAMARANTMSHQLPGEPDFAARILRAGYNYQTAGENVGWNSLMTQDGVLYLESLMYNEVPPNDGHRRNILSTTYRSIGIDVYFDHVHNKVWLTEDFGSLMP